MADTNSQREYNDLLKMTQSMLGDIGKSMDDIAKKSDKRNKSLEYEASFSAEIIKSLKSQEDIEKVLGDIKKQKNDISKKDFGTNTELSKQLNIQLIAAQSILKQNQSNLSILNKTRDTVNEYGDTFKSNIDSIFSKIENIPIIGNALGKLFDPFKERAKKIIDGTSRQFMNGFTKSFTKSRQEGGNVFKSFSSGLDGGLKTANTFLRRIGIGISAGMLLAGAAIIALFKIGLDRFKELDSAFLEFRNNTGLLNSQTVQLNKNIQNVSRTYAHLGVTASDVAKAAGDFSNEFDGIEQPSKAVLGSMVALNKNFGVGTAEAAKLNKVFQNIGGLSAEQSQALIGQTAEMAKMAGVAPGKVIKDMADNSGVAYQFFGGSTKELAKAAVAAAALGTSIAEAGKVARGLLDYQSSIGNELEASAILGTNINLSQARYLAANNDILGSQQAIIDEVGKLGDITKLNVYEQEALVAATGMEFSSLVNQQRIRERFGKLTKEQLAAANSLLDSGKDISKITDKDLQTQTKRLAQQQEMQSKMDALKNTFGALGTQLTDALSPLVGVVIDAATLVGKVLVPIFKGLGAVIRFAFSPITYAVDGFKNLAAIVTSIRDDGFAGMVSKMKELGPLMTGIAITVGVIATAFLVSIVPSILTFGALLITTIIPGLITAAGSAISWAIAQAAVAIGAITTTSALTLGFGALAIAAGVALAAGAFDDEMSSVEASVPSVDDGVVQDRQVVSTHPDDFLIATKDPAGLAESMSGGGVSISMDGVISQLKKLEIAFMSNKNVYIDGDDVTAKVTMRQESSSKNEFGMEKS